MSCLFLHPQCSRFLLSAAAVSVGTMAASADELLVSEFFEEILSVDSTTGAVTDLVDSPLGAGEPFGQHLEIGSDGTLYVTDFADLYTFTPGVTNPYQFKSDLGLDPQGMTRDQGGQLVIANPNGIQRVNPETGDLVVLHDETFFSAADVVVDQAGNIFATEFFDALGYIPAGGGGFIQIGDFDTNEFDKIDIGPDGQLYVAETFGDYIARIDPVTAALTIVAGDLDASTIVDLVVGDDGTVYFAGLLDGINGVYQIADGEPELIVGNNTIDFFSPQSLAISSGFRPTAVPEPAALSLLGLGAFILSRRRRGAC